MSAQKNISINTVLNLNGKANEEEAVKSTVLKGSTEGTSSGP
jgi:hypothetical protein